MKININFEAATETNTEPVNVCILKLFESTDFRLESLKTNLTTNERVFAGTTHRMLYFKPWIGDFIVPNFPSKLDYMHLENYN